MKYSSFLTVALQLFTTTLSAPVESTTDVAQIEKRASSYWLANIQRQGTVAFGSNSGYTVYRNVMSFGAKGDGVTDDTAAINNAISSGGRCGLGCDSSTTTPALVYFPPGTYLVSSPLIQYYYTQFVGDAVTPPTIKASSGFRGIAVIDSDPYESNGDNWYTNQNNFFRQVRNFVIDLTSLPMSTGAGIHWQVAQATSLQNIVFKMVQGGGTANKQQGIFMDNGSGGFMTDLVFNGGNYGAFLGNQQFTTRNLTFNGCNTAIFMNWNWVWALKSVKINNCGIGIDMSNSPTNQTVGSVLLQDSTISNTPVGVKTAFSANSVPHSGGTLIIDNVSFNACPTAVQSYSGSTILAGNKVVTSWGQGSSYTGSTGSRVQGTLPAPSKPAALLSGSGTIFERSKPQYQQYPASSFYSVKSHGAKGDGVTDDTAAVQSAVNAAASANQILYFDHGAYIISNTVTIPNNLKITGEIWPLIMAKGSAFQNPSAPIPVFSVGTNGGSGAVEMSDLIFETVGPQPGAILMAWHSAASSQGSNGIWDVHFRIGGSAGTQLQSNTCANNTAQTAPNKACEGAFLLFHATSTASVYIENSWFWVADHELDLPDHRQVSIYNGRGVLLENSAGNPIWMYGTSSEHSQMYNYGLSNAKNVFMSVIQTETPYYQPNPVATVPFIPQTAWTDPNWSFCAKGDARCEMAWGLKISTSTNVLVYGAGIYSFFDNYGQTCVGQQNCQENIVHVLQSENVYLMGLSTKASVNMVTMNGVGQVKDADNRSNFCATIARWVVG